MRTCWFHEFFPFPFVLKLGHFCLDRESGDWCRLIRVSSYNIRRLNKVLSSTVFNNELLLYWKVFHFIFYFITGGHIVIVMRSGEDAYAHEYTQSIKTEMSKLEDERKWKKLVESTCLETRMSLHQSPDSLQWSYIHQIKTQISNLVRPTHFWNHLHQVLSNSKNNFEILFCTSEIKDEHYRKRLFFFWKGSYRNMLKCSLRNHETSINLILAFLFRPFGFYCSQRFQKTVEDHTKNIQRCLIICW
jgi:hypothetical protein